MECERVEFVSEAYLLFTQNVKKVFFEMALKSKIHKIKAMITRHLLIFWILHIELMQVQH